MAFLVGVLLLEIRQVAPHRIDLLGEGTRDVEVHRGVVLQELLGILREWRIRDGYENASLWEEYR